MNRAMLLFNDVRRDSRVRSVLRREVLAICAIVFCGDLIAGIVLPSFSLFAESLGASVVFIGTLTTLSGVTIFASSIPVGLLSDRVGRRRVMFLGMISFAAAMTVLGLATDTALLVPGRLLLGLAMVATFWIASAQMGDVVGQSERGLAFGMMTSAMGLGFAIGPLIGGRMAAVAGFQASYLLAAAIALAGAIVVLTLIPRRAVAREAIARTTRPPLRASLAVGRDRRLVAAAIGNILTSIGFGGAVLTFFPLYGDRLGLSEQTILSMFTIRAIISTLARLPTGAIAHAIGSQRLMMSAVGLEVVAVFALGLTREPRLLLAMLALEGIAFGSFLTSAHAFIAEHTVPETRGAALGYYSTAGSLGSIAAPIGLGYVAKLFGLPAVFLVTGGLLLLGLGVLGWMRFGDGRPATAGALGEPSLG